MCFIKNSCIGSAVLIGDDPSIPDIMAPLPISKQNLHSYTSIQCCSPFVHPTPYYTNDTVLLNKLLASVNYNSHLLMKLRQNIEKSDNLLADAHKTIEEECQANTCVSFGQIKGWKSSENIIIQLFGDMLYKYKLKLRNKFPSTIYKERNIGLNIQLVDQTQKLVMNSNMMSLCVAACEVNGHWICENEEGEYFMQGKTEVELYHGEASFLKIYPRDVSRQFENGKIDIIIYPKPSLIKFSTQAGMVEQRVNAEEIEPLLIKDVTIRAKKKSK